MNSAITAVISNQKYIGQSILTRFKEHIHSKCDRTEKFSVALHIFEGNRKIHISNLNLLRNMMNKDKSLSHIAPSIFG